MFKQARQISEGESKELLHDSYVMYVNNHHCAACGGVERFSQCFEVWLHPTKTRTTGLRDLRSVHGPLKDLPLVTIASRERTIPICHRCSWTHQNTGKPAAAAPLTSEAWAETLKRKYAAAPPAEAKVATKSTVPPKAVPTLDQI